MNKYIITTVDGARVSVESGLSLKAIIIDVANEKFVTFGKIAFLSRNIVSVRQISD